MNTLLSALTEPQVDQLIKMLHDLLQMIKEGMIVLWLSLSPFLFAYLAFRQSQNRKALDENTKVSTEAFRVANGHNEKIAELTKLAAARPQKVEVVNPPNHPVPTEDVHHS